MTEKIKEWLQNELDKTLENKYIKEGWFDNIDIELFENKENKYKTSIIDCIKNCTSPNVSENKEITKEDLELIFKAFSLFEPKDTRVLILGQDPYTDKEKGKATGLAFLLNREVKEKDSLYYILKAIEKKNKINPKKIINPTNIENWVADNKVLLLNTSLTYEHGNKEERIHVWEPFMHKIIENLLSIEQKLVVFLWGNDAQLNFLKYISNIEIKRNLIIFTYNHPSRLNEINGKHFDCYEHFDKCNDFLKKHGKKEVYWKDLRNIYTKKD